MPELKGCMALSKYFIIWMLDSIGWKQIEEQQKYSFEQLWLELVMFRKYNKVWRYGDWIENKPWWQVTFIKTADQVGMSKREQECWLNMVDKEK
jgi:hypothetical protein